MIRTDLGIATAYAEAVSKGYTGTRDEFGQMFADFGKTAEKVTEDKKAVEQMKLSVEETKNSVDTTAAEFGQNVADKTAEAKAAITEHANTEKELATAAISEAKDAATGAITEAQTSATDAIASAKDSATAEITKKGTDTLATIPEDYTTLSKDIDSIKEDLWDLENNVGVDKKSMILGDLSLTNGQFVENNSKYAMHSNIEDKIPVKKGNIIKIDHSSFNISGFSVWDKTEKVLITGSVSDADGYVFKKDYEDICFKVASFNNIENTPKNICSIFGEKSNVALFANAGNLENVVESVRNATNALRENVEKITPIGFLEKELTGFSGCMRKDRKIVDLSQYGANYKHTNDIEVTEGEVYKITTKASINYPHFLLFDANKTFVASYYTITGKTDTSNIIITNYILTIPSNVKYMVINTYDGKWKFYEQTYINCVGKENGLTKKYFAFGDSVCRGNHPDTSKSDYAWVETFGKIMGMETHNMANGGQGYMTTVYQEKAINTIKSTDISNANLITLSFAINDASDASCPVGTLEDTTEDSIIGCAYSCIKYIYDTVPTCQVVVCGSTPQNGMRSTRLVEVNNQLKAMSERYNIPFIDLSDCPINGFNGKKGGALTSDGTHFNDDGYKLLSQFMTGKLSALFGYRQPFLI
jgi:lysophospholipase L1-like esterase